MDKLSISAIEGRVAISDYYRSEPARADITYLLNRVKDLEFQVSGNERAHVAEVRQLQTIITALKSAPFTRKDGTTSPVRGTVEDRRRVSRGASVRQEQPIFYGRRSNDRARWTGEAAPVVETVSEFCERAPYRHLWQTTPHGHDICIECKQTRPTQPAQEAPQPEKFVPKDAGTQAQIAAVMLATGTPKQQAEVLAHMANGACDAAQPEKPGLEQEFAATLYGGQSIDQWTRIKDYETRMAIWQLIRLIDARQGEK